MMEPHIAKIMVADIGDRWMTSNHSRETSAPTRVYFVDSPNSDEDCLALPRPGNRLKCYQIGAAHTDERHPPKQARYGGN